MVLRERPVRRGVTSAWKSTRRVSVEEKPPLEQPPRVIDRRAEEVEPGSTQAQLIAQCGGSPLRGTPHTGDDDAEHRQHLTEQHTGPVHLDLRISSAHRAHKDVLQTWGSVSTQCRSKTVIGIAETKKTRFLAGEKRSASLQRTVGCGVQGDLLEDFLPT